MVPMFDINLPSTCYIWCKFLIRNQDFLWEIPTLPWLKRHPGSPTTKPNPRVVRLPNRKFSAVVWLPNPKFSAVVGLPNPKMNTVVRLPNPKLSTVVWLPNPKFKTMGAGNIFLRIQNLFILSPNTWDMGIFLFFNFHFLAKNLVNEKIHISCLFRLKMKKIRPLCFLQL